MDKRIHKKNEKVVIYPGLVKRLIEKGMDALKEKDGKSAYEFFLEAEAHEQDHPQVLFGKMLSLVELGRLEEAVEHTAQLLYEGIGDYFDNLQVHISLLVQLGKYEEVVEIISAVLSEHRIPAQHAESFYQLLHFSRQMADSHKGEIDREEAIDDVLKLLQSDSLELQLKAITELKNSKHKKAAAALVSYVEESNRDLALQSMALKALHEKKYKDVVHVEKLGREMDVRPSELADLFETTFMKKLLAKLEAVLEHEHPFLLEVAKQLCLSHLLALYPFLPEPEEETFWAGVFHYCAAERLGLDEELNEIQTHYSIDEQSLKQSKAEVEKLESIVFQVHHLIQ